MVLKWIGRQLTGDPATERARQRARRVRQAAVFIERRRRRHMARLNSGLWVFLLVFLACGLLVVLAVYH